MNQFPEPPVVDFTMLTDRALVDLYKMVRDQRLQLDHLAKEWKTLESACSDRIIATTPVDSAGIVGSTHLAKVKSEVKPVIKDFMAFWTWIKTNDRMDFIEKRPATKAIMEYINTTGQVPGGLEPFHDKKISLTKV